MCWRRSNKREAQIIVQKRRGKSATEGPLGKLRWSGNMCNNGTLRKVLVVQFGLNWLRIGSTLNNHC
jgi:hypothetical protein